jgi:hypothetical protein
MVSHSEVIQFDEKSPPHTSEFGPIPQLSERAVMDRDWPLQLPVFCLGPLVMGMSGAAAHAVGYQPVTLRASLRSLQCIANFKSGLAAILRVPFEQLQDEFLGSGGQIDGFS